MHDIDYAIAACAVSIISEVASHSDCLRERGGAILANVVAWLELL